MTFAKVEGCTLWPCVSIFRDICQRFYLVLLALQAIESPANRGLEPISVAVPSATEALILRQRDGVLTCY
jgi:hypothetical protein